MRTKSLCSFLYQGQNKSLTHIKSTFLWLSTVQSSLSNPSGSVCRLHFYCFNTLCCLCSPLLRSFYQAVSGGRFCIVLYSSVTTKICYCPNALVVYKFKENMFANHVSCTALFTYFSELAWGKNLHCPHRLVIYCFSKLYVVGFTDF